MPWQPAAILYPDIELVLISRYRSALAARSETYAQDVHVSNTVPAQRHDRMVIIRRDGGTAAEMRDRARVTLRVWATTEQDANDLARLVMALAPTFADGAPILAVPTDGRSGPSPIPDTSRQHQRLIGVEFHTRGVPL